MRIKSVFTHSGQAVIEGALVSLLVVGLMAGTAFAARPGDGSATTSFSIADGSFAQTTTVLRGSATATWVRARCYQDGNLVYEQYVSYGGSQSATLSLGPTPMWSSGAATCTGEEGWWRNGSRWRTVGSDTFTVSG